MAQVVTNPFTYNEEVWLTKRNIPIQTYKWGSNMQIEKQLYVVLNHRKQTHHFFIAASAAAILGAIYMETNMEGFMWPVLAVPSGITGSVHFVLGRCKSKKIRMLF